MAKKNKEKKWSIKRGDTIYYESCGKIYKTEAVAIDGSDILTHYLEWENKRMFLRPDDPRIKDCVGYQEIVPPPEN
jgi:hypothetical protein